MVAGFPVQLSNLRGFLRLFGDRHRPCIALWLSAAAQLQSSIYLHLVFRILDALAHVAVELAPDLSLHPSRRQSPWRLQNLSESDDCDGAWRSLARCRTELSYVGTVAWFPAGDRTAVHRASSVNRLHCLSGGPHRLCLCLRHHAVDFLQAAELRSRDRLLVRHVHAKHESKPAETVLQSGTALFTSSHITAPCFPLTVRAYPARSGALSVRFDGCADVSRGRPRDLIHLFSVLIVVMQRISAAHWFARCGLGA